MSTVYPERPPYFAYKFTRLLAKTCAAQTIGAEGSWLLTTIAHTEDAKRYTGPVTFFSAQLTPLCGFMNDQKLARVRAACVKAGWLHYEPGAKRKPGIYWVTIPECFEEIPDTPLCETEHDSTIKNGEYPGSIRGVSREQVGSIRGISNENPAPFYPIPNPDPIPSPKDTPLPPKSKSAADDIYAAYPKKVGRAAAVKAILKALKTTTPDVLLDAVKEYASAVSRWPPDETQFVPNPSTWFNQERWKDDRSEWARRSGGSRDRPGEGLHEDSSDEF